MSSVIKIDYSQLKDQQISFNEEPYDGCCFEHQDDFEPRGFQSLARHRLIMQLNA